MAERPEINVDFADMLLCLQHASVDFLVVGAHALAAHGIARATGEIDRGLELAARGERRREPACIPGSRGVRNKLAAGRDKDFVEAKALQSE